ncbi:MAG: hypothetical protein AAFY17_17665 [Cyanobacteria bacterium J06642_11]
MSSTFPDFSLTAEQALNPVDAILDAEAEVTEPMLAGKKEGNLPP